MPKLTRRTLLASAPVAALPAQSLSEVRFDGPPDWDQWKLWYKQPAENWNAALPLGNGRLGAMVFGGVQTEVLQLNEDTLWSGLPRDTSNPKALEALPRVRKLLFEGKYAEATEAAKAIQGPFSETYLPLGYLRLKHEGIQRYTDYRHELDLDAAIVRSRYRVGRAAYEREYFISEPDQVLVMRVTARDGKWGGILTMDSPLRSRSEVAGPGGLALRGRAPSHLEHTDFTERPSLVRYDEGDAAGMLFEACVRVIPEGGRLYDTGNAVGVIGANAFTVLLAADTGFLTPFEAPRKPAEAISAECAGALNRAAAKPYDELRAAHIESHRKLFRRTYIDLGRSPSAARPTNERIDAYGVAPDPQLAALYFQFGRYLLIASSRPGTQAANLQGIWNDMVRAPWNSNYTNNINVEMNYWPAEAANLSECHEPMLRLIEELARTGTATAKSYYGLAGWVCHHNSDLWRLSNPVGDYGRGSPGWALWPMGGPWYCEHLWEHWRFTGDDDFARNRAYPVMREAARFLRGWLVEAPDGKLTTAPSTSPENVFLTAGGQRASVAMGSTMDLFLIRSLFEHTVHLSKLAGPGGGKPPAADADLIESVQAALPRLAMPGIGSKGQLLEWNEEFKEAEPGHRHCSPLIGLHPCNLITEQETPRYWAAARKLLEQRLAAGSGHTGWSRAWIINFWARFREGAKVEENLDALLGKSTLTNLFDNHPPFQIDGNFGGTAGIAEALLQSQNGAIDLLPALPPSWRNGRISGLKARGGITVGLDWRDGRLTEARLTSARAQEVELRIPKGRALTRIAVAEAAEQPSRPDAAGHYRVPLRAGVETLLSFGSI